MAKRQGAYKFEKRRKELEKKKKKAEKRARKLGIDPDESREPIPTGPPIGGHDGSSTFADSGDDS